MIIKYNPFFLPNNSFLKGKGVNELEHYILFQNFIPGVEEMEIDDATYSKALAKLFKKGYIENGKPTDRYFERIDIFTELKNTLKNFATIGSASELEDLIKILSPIRESKRKSKKNTFFELDYGNWKGELRQFIYEQFLRSSKGEGVSIQVGGIVNDKFMEEKILLPITNILVRTGRVTMENGKPVFTKEVIDGIINKLQTMFDWYEDKEKPIKNMKSTINTFFNNFK